MVTNVDYYTYLFKESLSLISLHWNYVFIFSEECFPYRNFIKLWSLIGDFLSEHYVLISFGDFLFSKKLCPVLLNSVNELTVSPNLKVLICGEPCSPIKVYFPEEIILPEVSCWNWIRKGCCLSFSIGFFDIYLLWLLWKQIKILKNSNSSTSSSYSKNFYPILIWVFLLFSGHAEI